MLSEVPREHAGSASGLINTVQQMGNALGLGLVSVVFFGEIGDGLAPAQVGPAFVHAFQHALWWVAGIMGAIFLLMSALPKRPAQHVEEAVDEELPVGEMEAALVPCTVTTRARYRPGAGPICCFGHSRKSDHARMKSEPVYFPEIRA